MVGFSLSTATADTAAREQFIQLMAIKQNRTEKGKNRTEQKQKLPLLRIKDLTFFQICEGKCNFFSYNQATKRLQFQSLKKKKSVSG